MSKGVTEIHGTEAFRSHWVRKLDKGISEEEVDLGSYDDRGHAAVARDLLELQSRWRQGDSRLPPAHTVDLNLPYTAYAANAKAVMGCLERPFEQLAVQLKSEGLAKRLYEMLTSRSGPADALGGSTLSGLPAESLAPERLAQLAPPPSDLVGGVIPKRPGLAEQAKQAEQAVPQPAALAALQPTAATPTALSDAAVQRQPEAYLAPPELAAAADSAPRPEPSAGRTGDEVSSGEPVPLAPLDLGIPAAVLPGAAAALSPAAAPSEPAASVLLPPAAARPPGGSPPPVEHVAEAQPAEPFHVWIKGNPEFPRGSGKYPFFVKAKPLASKYFTLSAEVCRIVLEHAQHGPLTAVQADDPSRSWIVTYFVKVEAHRQPGNYKGQRYLHKVHDMVAGLGIKPGDAVYLQRDDATTRMRVGVWKQGSAEASAFTEELQRVEASRKR